MKAYPLLSAELFYQQTFEVLKSANAGDEIYANYFVIRKDNYGLKFLSMLYQAAVKGVRIKLIIDSYGSLQPGGKGTEYQGEPLDDELLSFLKLNGIEIYIYRPIKSRKIFHPQNLWDWKNYSRRNHNKILSFKLKGKRGVIMGDSQWADEHFNGEFLGHDILLLSDKIYIQSKLYHMNLIKTEECVYFKESHVSRDKFFALKKQLMLKNIYPPELKSIKSFEIKEAQFVYSEIQFDQHEERHSIQDYEIDLLKENIQWGIYTTPYFSPDKDFLKVLLKFMQTGGEIRIGKFREDPYLPYGVLSVVKKIFKQDHTLLEYNGKGHIHYKDLITDQAVFIKSANGEGRSRYYNLDSGLIIRSKELSNYFLKIHQKEKLAFSEFKEFEYHHIPHPKLERMIKYFMRPLFYHHL
jgi:phosphatidylserine/phosphatidylglycerophosphate/cardiolipin synthase-like enzyme